MFYECHRRKMLFKKIVIGLLIWHAIIFYGFLFLMIMTLGEDEHFCFCGSNFFTNTMYICTKNTLLSYFTRVVPTRVLQPTYVNPFSFIQPMKIKTLNMVCGD